MRILVVEDDPVALSLMQELLTLHRHDVTAQDGPTPALEWFGAHPDGCDLTLTDFSMPGMNGLTFAERLHGDIPHDRQVRLSVNHGLHRLVGVAVFREFIKVPGFGPGPPLQEKPRNE